MQNYIKQLTDDIRKATFNVRPPRDYWSSESANSEADIEDLSFIEKYTEEYKEPISEITGISAEALPSPEKLSQVQKKHLATELEKLLHYFNFVLDFPKNLPEDIRYPVIYEFWKENHVAVSFGENRIELCNMEKANCPFPGYCEICDEVEEQMKLDEGNAKVSMDISIEDILPSHQEIEKWIETSAPDLMHLNSATDDLNSSQGEEEDNSDEIYGFYNDDGERIDPNTVPVPNLCIVCKKYAADNWEEDLLCLMNRHDQQKDQNFTCGAFEKI